MAICRFTMTEDLGFSGAPIEGPAHFSQIETTLPVVCADHYRSDRL